MGPEKEIALRAAEKQKLQCFCCGCLGHIMCDCQASTRFDGTPIMDLPKPDSDQFAF